MSLPVPASPPRRRQMKSCDTCRRRKVRCDSVDRSPCSNCRKLDQACVFTKNWERPARLRNLQSRPPTPAPVPPAFKDASPKQTSVSPASASTQSTPATAWDVNNIVHMAVASQSMARDSLHQFFEHGMAAEDWEVFDRSSVMRLAYVGTTASNLAHLMNLDPRRSRQTTTTTTGPAAALHLPHPHTHPITSWKPAAAEHSLLSSTIPHRDLCSFPVKHIRDAMVDAFFDQVNPYFPVIDESDFRRQYADPANPPPLLLMHAVLLAGAHVCGHPRVAAQSPSSRAVVTATLFARARALFDMRHENNRLHLVQCALLFTWHVENADSAGANSYYWAGVAGRIAFGLGMHRNLSPAMRACMMPLAERRLYRRVWWTLFQTEVWTALEHGRPSMMQPLDEFDQPPLEADDFCEGEGEGEDGGRVNEKLDFAYGRANIELCYVALEILRLNRPRVSSSPSETQATLAALDARLVDWILLHPATDDFASLQLHLHYNTVILHLHRKKFIRTDSASTSTEICGRAASAIVTTFETMLAKQCIAQSPFTATVALTAAAIHISLEMRRAIEAGSTLLALNTQGLLERLFAPCAELSRYWPNAEGVLKLFRSLLERFNSKVVSILKNGGGGRETSMGDGDGRRHENDAAPAEPEMQSGQGAQEGEGGDAGPFPILETAAGMAATNPMMDALDWPDIVFYDILHQL